MKITGDIVVPAPVQTVWDGLNDTDTLAAAIPGCQSVVETGDNAFDVVAKIAVGPVKATFRAKIDITDIDPPSSYVLNFKSHGGVAGVADGKAMVSLIAEGDATRLLYDMDVHMGGKLAQIGARLIQSTAAKMSAQFFGRFSDYLTAGPKTKESLPTGSAKQIPAAVLSLSSTSEPGTRITIEMSSLTVGIIMFVIGAVVGYLAAT